MIGTLPSSAVHVDSIPGRGPKIKIPHASRPKNHPLQTQEVKQKPFKCNRFSKDFKSDPDQKNLLKNELKLMNLWGEVV